MRTAAAEAGQPAFAPPAASLGSLRMIAIEQRAHTQDHHHHHQLQGVVGQLLRWYVIFSLSTRISHRGRWLFYRTCQNPRNYIHFKTKKYWLGFSQANFTPDSALIVWIALGSEPNRSVERCGNALWMGPILISRRFNNSDTLYHSVCLGEFVIPKR